MNSGYGMQGQSYGGFGGSNPQMRMNTPSQGMGGMRPSGPGQYGMQQGGINQGMGMSNMGMSRYGRDEAKWPRTVWNATGRHKPGHGNVKHGHVKVWNDEWRPWPRLWNACSKQAIWIWDAVWDGNGRKYGWPWNDETYGPRHDAGYARGVWNGYAGARRNG